MKSRAIILAAAVTAFAAVSCNVQPGAEEIQAQKDKVDALNRSFQMRLRDVQDSLMAIDNSMDEKREAETVNVACGIREILGRNISRRSDE